MDIRINFLDGVAKMTVRISIIQKSFEITMGFFCIDMAARILTKYRIARYPATIARYKMLRHRPDTPNQLRYYSPFD
jgi:hypothetical protein